MRVQGRSPLLWCVWTPVWTWKFISTVKRETNPPSFLHVFPWGGWNSKYNLIIHKTQRKVRCQWNRKSLYSTEYTPRNQHPDVTGMEETNHPKGGLRNPCISAWLWRTVGEIFGNSPHAGICHVSSSPSLPTDGLIKARTLVGMTYANSSVTTLFCNIKEHLRASEVTVPIKVKELYSSWENTHFSRTILTTSIPYYPQKMPLCR